MCVFLMSSKQVGVWSEAQGRDSVCGIISGQ